MGRTSDAKERLLKSAMELMHDQGFGAVGVSEICAHAGVKKGSFYHFFDSKQALALEVVESFRKGSRDFMESFLLGTAPPLERLAAYLDGIYGYHLSSCEVLGKQTGCPLANLALEMSTQDKTIRLSVLQAFEGQLALIESVLREASRAGDLPSEIDPRSGAETVLALVEGMVMFSKLQDSPEPLRNLKSQVFRCLGLAITAVA